MISNEDFSYKFDELKCQECDGNCCIGESGYIWITQEEIEALAKHLNLTVSMTIDKYLFKARYKYSIKEKQLSPTNYACVFFDTTKKQCSIYEARPKQCRTFPFWDYFKDKIDEVKAECPAIVD
jgi:Fe-S-cluster containining protein